MVIMMMMKPAFIMSKMVHQTLLHPFIEDLLAFKIYPRSKSFSVQILEGVIKWMISLGL